MLASVARPLAYEIIVDKLVLCNKWIELLENDVECLDNGEYISQRDRWYYVIEAKRERELWLTDLKQYWR
jgi:hypothetical protein